MGHSELIHACLEKVSERTDDLTPLVYARFFAQYPQAAEQFGPDKGDVVKGQMLNGILFAITDHADGKVYPEDICRWVHDHRLYETTLPMYPCMFKGLLDTIQELMAEDWTAEIDAAWQAQLDGLMSCIVGADQKT